MAEVSLVRQIDDFLRGLVDAPACSGTPSDDISDYLGLRIEGSEIRRHGFGPVRK